MSELFGSPSGDLAYREDARAQQLAQLSLAEGSVKLQSSKLALASQQKMLQQLSQGDLQNSPDMPSQLDRLAQMALSSGLPEQAREYATSASTLRKNQSEIADKQVSQQIKGLNFISSVYEDVTDQTSKQQADAYFQMVTGKPSPVAQMPYNPMVIDKLKQGVQSAKDKALTQAAQARTKVSESMLEENKARVPLIKAQTAEAQMRATKLAKEGAVDKAPGTAELKTVADLIEADFGADKSPQAQAQVRAIARPIAEQMLQLRKTSGLTESEAAQRAYQEAKARGDTAPLQGAKQAGTEHIVGQIDTLLNLIDTHKALTGAPGMVNRAYEWASNSKDQGAHEYQTRMNMLIAQLPSALQLKGRLNKDDKNRLADAVDSLKSMSSPNSAKRQLETVRELLTGEPRDDNKPDQTPVVKSEAEWAALAPGTRYIGPDGQPRTKRGN